MAFALENNSNNPRNNNADWKAQGFLNFYLTLKSGKRVKVGAIPLKESNALHKQLLSKLQDDEAAQKLLNILEMNFQTVGQQIDADELDL